MGTCISYLCSMGNRRSSHSSLEDDSRKGSQTSSNVSTKPRQADKHHSNTKSEPLTTSLNPGPAMAESPSPKKQPPDKPPTSAKSRLPDLSKFPEDVRKLLLGHSPGVKMKSQANVVRIYVSSIQDDSEAERAALMDTVFPKLREYAATKGVELHVVDPHWGVWDPKLDDERTVDLCKEEIDRCQRLSIGPNFVTFLNQKYGRLIAPCRILASAFDRLLKKVGDMKDKDLLMRCYKLDQNAVPAVYVLQGSSTPDTEREKICQILRSSWSKEEKELYLASVGENEIEKGVFSPHSQSEGVIWVHRHFTNISHKDPAAHKHLDIGPDGEIDSFSQEQLVQLSKRLATKVGQSNFLKFDIPWNSSGLDPDGIESHRKYLEEFCSKIHDSLKDVIDKAITEEEEREPRRKELIYYVPYYLLFTTLVIPTYPQAKCRTCKKVMAMEWDEHDLCPSCRSCSQSARCYICRDWTDQWKWLAKWKAEKERAKAKKRNEQSAKKAGMNGSHANQEGILQTMALVPSNTASVDTDVTSRPSPNHSPGQGATSAVISVPSSSILVTAPSTSTSSTAVIALTSTVPTVLATQMTPASLASSAPMLIPSNYLEDNPSRSEGHYVTAILVDPSLPGPSGLSGRQVSTNSEGIPNLRPPLVTGGKEILIASDSGSPCTRAPQGGPDFDDQGRASEGRGRSKSRKSHKGHKKRRRRHSSSSDSSSSRSPSRSPRRRKHRRRSPSENSQALSQILNLLTNLSQGGPSRAPSVGQSSGMSSQPEVQPSSTPMEDPLVSDQGEDSQLELFPPMEVGGSELDSNASGSEDEPLFGTDIPPDIFDKAVGILRAQLGYPASVQPEVSSKSRLTLNRPSSSVKESLPVDAECEDRFRAAAAAKKWTAFPRNQNAAFRVDEKDWRDLFRAPSVPQAAEDYLRSVGSADSSGRLRSLTARRSLRTLHQLDSASRVGLKYSSALLLIAEVLSKASRQSSSEIPRRDLSTLTSLIGPIARRVFDQFARVSVSRPVGEQVLPPSLASRRGHPPGDPPFPLRGRLDVPRGEPSTPREVQLDGRLRLQCPGVGGSRDPKGAHPAVQPPAVGGRLMLFQDSWGRIQPDSWVRNVISQGYLIEFTSPPLVGGLLRVTPVPAHLDKRLALEKEIQDLLSKGAIHQVSPESAHELYRSSFFLTPKKPNTWHPILNLKPLNKAFIRPKRFRMETLASIIPSLSRGMWATSVDLTDAYLHVPIHASHQRFLAFRYRGRDYAFNAMPFGLSTAPRVFTRITRTVLAFLRKHGVLVFAYLDDWLILAHSEQQAVETTQFVVETLQALGWIINTGKSLTPSQRVTYLGAILDFSLGQAFPTPERIQALAEVATLILSRRSHQARTWLRLLGLMASLVEVLPFCRLYMRPVQFHTLFHFKPDTDPLTTPIPVTEEVIPFVRWWTHHENVLQGRPFRLHRPQTSISTDASLTGWGATWGPNSPAGQWSDSEKLLHINVLELRAIKNAVLGWISDLKGFDVMILSDNSTAVAYVNHQGGTKSLRLCRDTWDLLLLCQRNDINLRATHLAERLNLQADALSRGLRNESEWELSQPWANLVFDLFGRPVEGRRSLLRMDRPVILCVSTLEHGSHNPVKAGSVAGRDAVNRPLLAEPGVVPAYLGTSSGPAIRLSDGQPHSNSRQRKGPAPETDRHKIDSLEIITKRLQEEGISERAASLAAGARRQSTSKTYDTRLEKFSSWADANACNPLEATVNEVCSFLVSLFDEGKQVSTIRNYRSAIASIHPGFSDGSRVGTNPTISGLLKGMFNRRPPTRKLAPSWSINKVLETLSRPPFEPIQDAPLDVLTKKTLFLVAAASARRRSEIHALSTKKGFIRFSPQGVYLLPDPDFLSKNQSETFTPRPIFLPSIASTSSVREDRFVCPVRCLKWYLQKTSTVRTADNLFLLPRTPYTPASRDTISKWIVQMISPHANHDEQVRAHDVRAHASSAAWFQGIPLQQIMEAAAWKTPSTFVASYLTNVISSEGVLQRSGLSDSASGRGRGRPPSSGGRPPLLCDQTCQDLNTGIDERLYEELQRQSSFCQQQTETFHGQSDILNQLESYLSSGKSIPLILHGGPGCGKTSIAAMCTKHVSSKTACVVRFVGTSLESQTINQIFRSACDQIACLYGGYISITSGGMEQLQMDLLKLLDRVTADRPLLLILDGVDQLEDSISNFDWLPKVLPPHVKMILTCNSNENKVYSSLKSYLGDSAIYLEVTPLKQGEVSRLTDLTLKSISRTVTEEQSKRLKSAAAKCSNPLYVQLACYMAGTVKSYTPQEDLRVEKDVTSQINSLFDFLESRYGKLAVAHTLSYVTACRYGIRDGEMMDVLSCDDKVLDSMFANSSVVLRRVPSLLWTALSLELKWFLIERTLNQMHFTTWKFPIFAEVVCKRYMQRDVDRKLFNRNLQDYFQSRWSKKKKPFTTEGGIEAQVDRFVLSQPDKYENYANIRKFQELPFQAFHAGEKDFAKKFIWNADWLSRKMQCCSVYEFISDIALASATSSGEDPDLVTLRQLLELSAYALTCNGAQLFPHLQKRIQMHSSVNKSSHPKISKLLESAVKYHILKFFLSDGCLKENPVGQQDGAPTNPAITGLFRMRGNPSHMLSLSTSRKEIIVWNILSHKAVRTLKGVESPRDVRFIDEHRVVVLCNRELKIFNLELGTFETKLKGIMNVGMPYFSLHDKDHVVALARNRMNVNIINVESGDIVSTFKAGEDRFINSLLVSDNGLRCVCGDETQKPSPLLVWDLQNRKLIHDFRIQQHEFVTKMAAISSDGHYVVSVIRELEDLSRNFVIVYDLQSGQLFKKWKPPVNTTCVDISSEGMCVINGCEDAVVLVWDLVSGSLKHRLLGHTHPVDTLCLSEQGTHCLTHDSTNQDRSVILWSLKTGECLACITPDLPISCCQISADGSCAVMGLSGHPEIVSVRLLDEGGKPKKIEDKQFGDATRKGQIFELAS
ncbi:NACHT domain- and WD repeat-containing protein 1 [Holothuria leucospilota]|uniref:NACHT domain- and WD repeat-containing protein 1 n=1 Tax=Holothuria leucospilota TaxID=206669 RepID=A0A9Q1HDG0_HOLLE|nr:NACHT domain- and WD repeat-containing protein 1 [Holothuria leucospilota]